MTENHSFSSYPDSGNSSPRSREVDCENSSWDEQQQQQPPPQLPQSNSYRVRFMCSYGGKIHPRPHDNQLAYVGGDTKILGVDRNIKFSALMAKLSALCDSPEVCLKYQLPGEDLDALISVTNDEDLEHMMIEYDRLHKTAPKPARLRLFLFPLSPQSVSSLGNNDVKSEGERQQWLVDALNSAQLQSLDDSSPPAATPPPPALNPDFLFGLDKGLPAVQAAPATVEVSRRDVSAGSDCGSEDRHAIGDTMLSQAEIQRQIQELQRMQIANPALQRRVDEANARVLAGDPYGQQVAEKVAPASQAPVPVSMPVQIPAGYMPERHLNSGSYAVSGTGNDQAVYYIPAPVGGYLGPTSYQPVSGQVGQALYGVQRVVPDVYREHGMYGTMPQQGAMQQQLKGAPCATEGIQVQQSKLTMAEPGFTQVAYDSSGRQVYYTTAAGGAAPAYQAAAAVAVDGRQGGGVPNQEAGK
ncbi:uncharacterized protein LOC116201967 isoform X2 [Punica granatum]|uniref:Uncharacterized protein LOC116201967 isoform X2 n=1 Tax=Punica granatum TaxID=22663 RepID=A0A218WEW1_PUNGR|nr:uncharacterized protein LOC116201967 isoform X2 [Punica granatum]OWM71355.1 hypothetical protein CDL15_Pgr011484 [Punica granatum]